jgi:hypothetical protein
MWCPPQIGPELLYLVSDPDNLGFGVATLPWAGVNLAVYNGACAIPVAGAPLPAAAASGLLFDASRGQLWVGVDGPGTVFNTASVPLCVVASDSAGVTAQLNVRLNVTEPSPSGDVR